MKGKLEKFIQQHSTELDQRTPHPAVLARILKQMEQEKCSDQKTPEKKRIMISFKVLPWSAAACFVLMIGLALWKYRENANPKEMGLTQILAKAKTLKKPAERVRLTDRVQAIPQTKQQRFAVVDQEGSKHKTPLAKRRSSTQPSAYKLVLLEHLSNKDSPASRIRALSETEQWHQISNDVVDVLVETMNHDPNINVRLAALGGLSKFYPDTYVRQQLISALKEQQEPMVQIALIGLMTRMKEAAILTELEDMVKDNDHIDAVKETAYAGIFELRGS